MSKPKLTVTGTLMCVLDECIGDKLTYDEKYEIAHSAFLALPLLYLDEVSPYPDDWIEPCMYCTKPVVIIGKSVILSLNKRRWTYCSIECLNNQDKQEGEGQISDATR